MPKGNNIPFMPGAYSAPRGGTPVEKFSKKHGIAGARMSDGAGPYPNGNAAKGGQPNNMAVLQRAAGKRLLHGKPGAFAADYPRNTKG